MTTITPINPQVVYVQATTPTDLTKGKLWYNTTNNSLYSSNGSTYNLLESDLTYIDQQQLEQDINILINSAGASTTLNDYDDMYLDLITDTNGNDNTIDTGNTTATFTGSTYSNTDTSDEDQNEVLDTEHLGAQETGMKITMTSTRLLNSITKHNLITATTGYLYASDGTTLIATSEAFSGDEAVFLTKPQLTSGQTYYITMAGGGSITNRYKGSVTYPISGTNLDWVSGRYDGGDSSNQAWSLTKITYTSGGIGSDSLVQTNAQSITADPTAHQLYCHNSLEGSGSITYDISFDGGSTWITDQEINTKNTSVHDGSSMIIKINLNGVGAGNTSEIKDYAIMLYN